MAEQTNKNFSVYIGNDAGDTGIEKIVSSFSNRLNIDYCYFENNLGGGSLAKQWERCLRLINNEAWLWLLPDDDFIDPNCVDLFYKSLENNSFDLFRFNVHFVTADEKIFKTNSPLPPIQSSFENLLQKLSFARPGTVAEFIFRRRKFEQIGFAEIPLAWGTDDLLWFLLGNEKGIFSCNDAFVYLRQSDLNISNNYTSLGLEKIRANFIFLEKLMQTQAFAKEIANNQKEKQFAKTAIDHIFYNIQDFSLKLQLNEMHEFALKGNRIWGGGVLRNFRRFYLNNKRIRNNSI
ncbi:MAG: glycosyltransferase family 2 protein [Bacteroidota bacterium]|nr:glycosyltransferase family 2 protein [Bacteroidota bacterium]